MPLDSLAVGMLIGWHLAHVQDQLTSWQRPGLFTMQWATFILRHCLVV